MCLKFKMRWRKSKSPKTEPCRAPILRSSHRKQWRNIYSQFAEDFCFVFVFFSTKKAKKVFSHLKKKSWDSSWSRSSIDE